MNHYIYYSLILGVYILQRVNHWFTNYFFQMKNTEATTMNKSIATKIFRSITICVPNRTSSETILLLPSNAPLLLLVPAMHAPLTASPPLFC
jgi:hypothetical protein